MQNLLNGFTLWGLGIAVFGLLIRWWASRYDLKDKALASAFQTVRGKRSSANPTELERELRDITDQKTLMGKTTKAVSKVAGHFMAEIGALIGLGFLLLGLVLAAYGVFAK